MYLDKWEEFLENEPDEDGWYAIHYCWDGDEGSFVGVDLRQEGKWKNNLPVIHFQGPFESEESASEWAETFDISF